MLLFEPLFSLAYALVLMGNFDLRTFRQRQNKGEGHTLQNERQVLLETDYHIMSYADRLSAYMLTKQYIEVRTYDVTPD